MSERSSLGIIVLIVAVLSSSYFAREKGINQPAPGFSLPDGYGGQLDLESYRGRPVLLVFWATWCGICQREMPLLNQMQGEFDRKGVSVLAIHLGGKENADGYMRSNRIYLTSVADPAGVVGRAYHVSGLPSLVLIGKDGKVKRASSGWTGENVLRDWIEDFQGS